MGLFSENNSKEEEKHIYSIGANGIDKSNKKDIKDNMFSLKLFEAMSKCTLKMNFVLNTYDIEDYEGLLSSIEAIDESIYYRTFDEADLEDACIKLLEVFGYKTIIESGTVKFISINNKERVKSLLDYSYNNDILDIKFVAYIEGNTEVEESIPYDADDLEYSIAQLVELCEKLETVKYDEFLLSVR